MDEYKEVYNDGTIRLTRSKHGWGMQMPPAATTILVRNGKVILIEDKKTEKDRWLWNCPGGMIEGNETTAQAAARECEEETGIIPTKLEKFASIETDFPSTHVDYFIGSGLEQGERAPWVEAKLENIGQVKEHTWDELYDFAVNYQLRDPRFVVAVLLLAKQTELLKSHGLI
ncbi:MAG: NUDIX domain-containing protein [Candidatus Saccharibacteria bacterium]